ncbi:MAG: PASTA domain-containing protein [Ignavibacteria bacterium]|nr:PASTA domain-containing protein [Ignavibacteria bacterium]
MMDNADKEQSFLDRLAPWKRYGIVIIGFVTILFILTFLADKIILPLIVHSNSTVKVPNVLGKSIDEARIMLGQSKLEVQGIREVANDKAPKGTIINQLPYPDAEVKEERRVYLTVSKGKEIVRVPTLIGKTLRDARVALLRLGLQIGTTTYEFSETMQQDLVSEQSVPAGGEAQFNEAISVVLSRGSESQITVPDLVNGTMDEAREKLLEAGLILGEVTDVHDDTYMGETILNQNPAAGTIVPKNTPVRVSVTK